MHRRWTVGELSTMLEIAAPTLRTWERRYGVGPTFRTSGGHRRYTVVDADRVATMARMISAGVPARAAAERVQRMSAHEIAVSIGRGTEAMQESVLERSVTSIVDGARHFDVSAVQVAVEEAVALFGIEEGWDKIVVPALIEVGAQWHDGRLGVAAEHLLSARIVTVLRSATHAFATHGPSRVVLASAEEEQHTLPIVALGAALASRGHASTELGSRLPLESLEAFVAKTKPEVVFLWSSVSTPSGDHLERLGVLGRQTHLLLGGSGWPAEVVTSSTLAEAVEQVRLALGDDLS